jgi:Uma2 family endonuclease
VSESEIVMTAATQRRLVTVEEFEKYPRDFRYNLVEGELVPMPPAAGPDHGALTSDLSFELTAFVKSNGLGQCYAAETGFVAQRNPDTVQAPDWAFISRDRVPKGPTKGFGRVVPDAVLEVRSPDDSPKEVERKMRRWIDAGVKLAWELNPKTGILTTYRPGIETRTVDSDGEIDGEDVLPGFSLPLKSILRPVAND